MASKGPRKTDNVGLSQNVPHLLRLCGQRANDLFAQELNGAELTRTQFTLLFAVEQHEGASQTELVERTGIDRSTLAEMMGRLIDKGILNRQRTQEDARANSVRITPAGKKLLRPARVANERVEKQVLGALPASDRPKFARMLATIDASLAAHSAKGRRARRKPRPAAGR